MVVAAGGDEQAEPVRQIQHDLLLSRRKGGVVALQPHKPRRPKAFHPCGDLLLRQLLRPVRQYPVGQHRNAARAQNGVYGLLRRKARLAAVIALKRLEPLILRAHIPLFQHHGHKVRPAGVFQRQQLRALLVGEGEAVFFLQIAKSVLHFQNAAVVGKGHRLPNGRLAPVEAVAQHVVFPPPVLAGELHAPDKRRIPLPQQRPHGGASLGGVVIRQGKEVKPRLAHAAQKRLGRVRAVGIYGVHVQIRFFIGALFHKRRHLSSVL